MYSAVELAKYIVRRCLDEGCPVSNLQLQKIMYFIQRDFLQKEDRSAFREDIEAWRFGPVVPKVYYLFCGSGAMPIHIVSPVVDVITNDDIKMIDIIVEDKRSKDPWDLVEETHKKNGPWDLTYQNGKGFRQIISRDIIKKHG